jgi:3' exoribonuclease family, domain 2
MSKPVAGVEIGLVNGVLTVNPTKAEMAESSLQLTVAGTKDGILMIEGAANFLPEEIMVEALKLGMLCLCFVVGVVVVTVPLHPLRLPISTQFPFPITFLYTLSPLPFPTLPLPPHHLALSTILSFPCLALPDLTLPSVSSLHSLCPLLTCTISSHTPYLHVPQGIPR